jgi:hypothetical protein
MNPSISSIKSTSLALAASFIIPLSAHAQLVFSAGTQVATQTQPFVNNLIDLNLADFTNNSTTALTGYTATRAKHHGQYDSGKSHAGILTHSRSVRHRDL